MVCSGVASGQTQSTLVNTKLSIDQCAWKA